MFLVQNKLNKTYRNIQKSVLEFNIFGSCSCMIPAIKPISTTTSPPPKGVVVTARLDDWTLPDLVLLRDHWLFEPKGCSAVREECRGTIQRRFDGSIACWDSIPKLECCFNENVCVWTCSPGNNTTVIFYLPSMLLVSSTLQQYYTILYTYTQMGSSLSPLLWNCALCRPFAKTR